MAGGHEQVIGVMARDSGSPSFYNARVHPLESSSQVTSGKVWAQKRLAGIPPKSSGVIYNDPLTCDSVGSQDIVMADPMDTNLSSSKTESEANGDAEGLAREQENRDVSIEISNINDIHVSPAGKKIIQNGDKDYLYSMSAPVKRLEHPADKSLFWSFLVSIVFLIAALIVLGPAFAVLMIFLPLGILLKSCMACCCCCTPNRACACCCSKVLSHTDAIWLHDTPLNKSIVQSLITLENGLDTNRIKDLVDARLICAERKGGARIYPRFTQKIVPLYSGYAWTNDPSFSIDNHIFVMPSSIQTQKDLQDYVSEMAMQELDKSRPLWEMHVLVDFGEAKDTVVLFRMHPALSDGVSMIQILFTSVMDTQSMHSLKPRFGHGAFVFNAIRALVIGPLVFLQKWIFTRKDYNLIHGPPLSGKKVVTWSEPYSLAKATRVKQVTRSTLNDVLLTVVAGNIRTYLQSRGVSNPYDMLATIPIDLRTDGPKVKMGSKFALIDINLPTNTEGTIPRLWEIKHQMDEVKNSADSIIMYGCQWVLTSMLPEWIYQKIWQMIWNKTTCVISNLPGPETTLTFVSREVRSIIYWMPTPDDVALSISFLTYADQLRMAVIADRAIVPNPEIITKDFIFQLDKLSYLLANRRIPGEHPGRRVDSSLHDDNAAHKEPTVEELQTKMAEVQQQLQDLKSRLDVEAQETYSDEERALVCKVEQLKEEFRELLAELRRKRQAGVLSDDDEDEDGELRRSSYRKRTLSGASRRSFLSSTSTARPLTTSPPATSHASPPDSRVHTPSSPTYPIPLDRRESDLTASPSAEQQKQLLTHEQVVVLETNEGPYSPQVERKC